MRVETERMYLYPLSDEEMRLVIENESDAEMKQAYAEMLEGSLYSLTESPFPDRLYKKWKDGRRGTEICIRR